MLSAKLFFIWLYPEGDFKTYQILILAFLDKVYRNAIFSSFIKKLWYVEIKITETVDNFSDKSIQKHENLEINLNVAFP